MPHAFDGCLAVDRCSVSREVDIGHGDRCFLWSHVCCLQEPFGGGLHVFRHASSVGIEACKDVCCVRIAVFRGCMEKGDGFLKVALRLCLMQEDDGEVQ